jgi:hypothetical protein
MAKDKRFTGTQQCRHCGNRAPMEIGAELSRVQSHEDERTGYRWEAGPVFQLLTCPACYGVTLQSYGWHSEMDPEDADLSVLYPSDADSMPSGLPDLIRREFEAAQKVRALSPNAYGVLMGRMLELVCKDRGAEGHGLHQRLTLLAKMGEIPQRLVEVADQVRKFRNLGAHAGDVELTVEEVPILDSLSRAVLEYVYSAPHMVEQAREQFERLSKHTTD